MLWKLRKLKQSTKQIHLTENEKFVLRQQIHEYVKNNPITYDVRIQNAERRILQPNTRGTFLFLNHKYMFASLVIILVVALGGGVSYAAEGSVPGHPLYPVKEFNEEVRAALTVSTEDDAKWDARRVERRLEEATTLAAQGKLTDKNEATLETKLENQIEEAKKELKKLETAGNIETANELSARLGSALALHNQILSSLTESDNKKVKVKIKIEEKIKPTLVTSTPRLSTTTPFGLIRKMRLRSDEVEKIKVDLDEKVRAEVKTQSESAAQAKIASAKHKVEEVKNFIRLKGADVSAETKTKAEAQLKLAEGEIVTAEAKLQAKSFAEAFIRAQKAHDMAQRAKLIVTTEQKMKVKLNVGQILNSIEIEEEQRIEAKIKIETEKREKKDEEKDKARGKIKIDVKSNTIEIETDKRGKTENSGTLRLF